MTMKAYAQITKDGQDNVLELLELYKPTATGNDLLVKVKAVATNPVDLKNYQPRYRRGHVELPNIVGFDASGIVEAVGERVSTFKVGDEVYFAGDVSRQGANAEYTLVDERITGRKPKSLNWEQAASVPLCTLTAWEPLVENAGICIPKEGERNLNENKSILIIGGAGGVGSILIQIAKKILKFGKVIATASRPETVEWCKRLGADAVINHTNLKADLANIGFNNGVNYVYVTPTLNNNLESAVEAVRPTGTIIGITGLPGTDIAKLRDKRLTLIVTFMFSRALNNDEPEKQGEILNMIGELIDKGVIVHTQNHHFEWNQLREAQKFQESGKAIGKITLTVKF